MVNLSPQEKAVGKGNFHAAATSELTRRQFVGGTLAAGAVAGAAAGGFYFGYKALNADPVRVGVIGTGDEGSVLIGAHNPDYIDIVAIADIRPYNVHRAFHGDPNAIAVRPGLINRVGYKSEDDARKHVTVYEPKDHDDPVKALLADDSIEAVIIALPLHLHASVAIQAMRAGKHVLTEKLMGYSVGQCKEMARVANETQMLLGTGHQRHYSILYDNAVHMIKQGLLGELHHIRAQWHRTADSWYQPLPDETMVKSLAEFQEKLEAAEKAGDMKRAEDVRKRVNDLTIRYLDNAVDAAKYGYEAKSLSEAGQTYMASPLEELIRWRLWNRTGGGLMAELGSHQLDAAGIFCTAVRADGKKARPLSVQACGGRHLYPLNREADDHVYCMYEYPGPGYDDDPNKKIVVTYSSINGNGFGGYGEVVMGTKGTLVLQNELEAMLYAGSSTTTSVQVTKGKDDAPTLSTTESGGYAAGSAATATSRGYTEEMEHFAWCIRNFDYENNQPKCKPDVALADAVIALTTNIAIRDNRRIEFKPEWFDIASDETPEGVPPELKA